MSHVICWMIIAVACIAGHATGGFDQDAAATVMWASAAALAAHYGMTKLYTLSSVDDGMPHADLHGDFIRSYFRACKSSLPVDWQEAALAAKRWEIAVGKPRHHIHHQRRPA